MGPDVALHQSELDFQELAGRTEGVVRALLLLATKLEMQGTLDGPLYSANLREQADRLCFAGTHLRATQRTMREMARAMDAARMHRESAL